MRWCLKKHCYIYRLRLSALIALLFILAGQTSTMAQDHFFLPQTGQTQSYATGDDGDLQLGVQWPDPRFTDNGDGTVTDNLTELLWLKNAKCFGQNNWNDALVDSNNLADGQCGLSDGSSAGDWRLPNVREHLSLVDYGQGNPPLPAGHPFTDVQLYYYYWTSSTVADRTPAACVVSMEAPYAGPQLMDDVPKSHVDGYFWPVRSGTDVEIASAPVPQTGQTQSFALRDDGDLEEGLQWPDPRFTDNGNGTVTDNLSGLIWLKNVNCLGEKNWNDALDASNNLANGQCGLSDGSCRGDWHLPNVSELRSLIDHGQAAKPPLPAGHPFTDVQQAEYWTSSTVGAYPVDAWIVHFWKGSLGNAFGQIWHVDKTDHYGVWPVRKAQISALCSGETTTQMFSDGFSSTQGQNNWHYLYRTDGNLYQMSWDDINSRWMGIEPYLLIGKGWFHPGPDYEAVLRWIAPSTGSITISGTVLHNQPGCSSRADGVEVKILHESSEIWSNELTRVDSIAHEISSNITAGESISFVVSSGANNDCDSTNWNPIIRSNAILLGDINGDGEVALGDAVVTMQVSSGLDSMAEIAISATDVNEDGKIGIAEAIYVLQEISGKRLGFSLRSPAFLDWQPIHRKYGYKLCGGDDISPPLVWSNVPPDTRSFALIMEDPNFFAVGSWTHWVVYDIPATARMLVENAGANGDANLPVGAKHGISSWAEDPDLNGLQYHGPCPKGMHPHHIKLYALDKELLNPASATADGILAAMEGHIIGEALLVGKYKPEFGCYKGCNEIEIAGLPEVVFDWTDDRCEDSDIPDLSARAFRDDKGQVQLIASHYKTYRKIGPSLDDLTHQCQAVMHSGRNADPSLFNDSEWVGATYTEDGKVIYALIHNEYQGWDHPGQCATQHWSSKCWYNALTTAVSTDSGLSYHHLGTPPNHLVATYPEQYSPNTGPFGAFTPSNIVKGTDNMYYSMVQIVDPAGEQWACLMRTNDLSQPGSWRFWNGTGFEGRFINPYPEAPISKDPHVCQPIDRSDIVDMRSSLTYNEHIDRYVLISHTSDGNTHGFYYSLSTDLIEWTTRKLLMEVPPRQTVSSPSDGWYAYPSLIDPNSSSRNFETTGKTAYLYYTRRNFGQEQLDRDLLRVKVRFHKK